MCLNETMKFAGICVTVLLVSICEIVSSTTCSRMAVDTSSQEPSNINVKHCQVRGHCTLPEGFVYLEDYYEANVQKRQEKHLKGPFRSRITVTHKIQECLRYATDENFTGQIVKGYGKGSRAVTTVAAAEALFKAQTKANELGYSLIVYDSYRPKKAVDFFVKWGEEADNCSKCRENYFPDTQHKRDLFHERDLFHPRYIAPNSKHSAGNTIDLSLIPLGLTANFPPIVIKRRLSNNQTVSYLYDQSLDMYTSFDLLSPASWPLDQANLIPRQGPFIKNRKLLRDIMIQSDFIPLESEWWHFSLNVTHETAMDFEF